MSTVFPFPFGGIKKKVVCEDQVAFNALVLALTTCHPHNIALEPEKLTIYASEQGAQCALTWYGQKR